MSKKPESLSEDDVVESLQVIDEDPASFDAFIENWNSIFETSAPDMDGTFSEVEAAAASSITSMTEAVPESAVGRRVAQLLEQFNSPVYLVREDGQIAAQNSAAIRAYRLVAKQTLDDLPFALELDERITDVVRASLDPRRNVHEAVLKRAYSTLDDSLATLSIAPSKSPGETHAEALVFVIDGRWKTAAAGLIKREFDLSKAEQELLVGFLDGQTTQSMATLRNRSHATIRTQFHSLMVKMGARTQTELFRNALSVSHFVDQIEEISEVVRHPHRKRVDLVRPGGRSVEVTMAGDLTGAPIVFVQSGVAYTFTGAAEKAFLEAGFCMLSICRPGYGDTDPPLAEDKDFTTFAEDIAALLDQLGHKTCMLLGSNTSTSVMFATSKHLPSRVVSLVQAASAPPLSNPEDFKTGASWAQGVIRAMTKHPNLKTLIIKSAIKAWKTFGQARFFALQFRHSDAEREQLLRPDILVESQRALDIATLQGFEPMVNDTILTFSDFSKDVLATDIPILIVHGKDDTVFPIETVREFANDHADRTTLIEIEGAGFPALETHTAEILNHIADFARDCRQS